MVNLTAENKEIIRKYYYDMYKLKLEVKDEFSEDKYKELKDFIDYKIEKYLLKETKLNDFSKFIKNTNGIKKTKIEVFPINSLIMKARSGDIKSLEYIIRYYQIKYEFNYTLNNNLSIVNIAEGKKEIERVVRTYFENNMNIKLSTYINNVIKFESGDSEYNIAGVDKKREILYYSNYYRTIKHVSYNGILTDIEFKNYIFSYLKLKIDKYLDDEEKNELNLSNYINTLIGRLINYSNDDEKILIRYNRFFNNRYDDTVEYLYKKYRYLLSKELKNNNINIPAKVIKYEKEYKGIVKNYLNNKINGFCYTRESSIINSIKKVIAENEKKYSNFDYVLARNGTTEEKEEQKLILLKEFEYLKEHFKNKFIYYTDYEEVKNRIDCAYENIVEAYINGVSTKEPTSYIKTRMNQNLELFRKSKESKFIKNDTEYLFATKCMAMIHNYIDNNSLSDDEFTYFIEYCKNAFNYYVNSGSYKEDIKEFMFKVLTSYDKEFSKEVSFIKKHL